LLHAVFEVPPDKGFTVGDISIDGSPIAWASQIAQKFQISLFPLPIPQQDTQPVTPCVVPNAPCTQAQPQQIMAANLFTACYGTFVANPRQFPMSLASNTIVAALEVTRGQTAQMAVVCSCITPGPRGELPTVAFAPPGSSTPDPNIRTRVQSVSDVFYAIPGNSYPSESQLLMVEVAVNRAAAPGQRDIRVANFGQPAGAQPFALLVV
jgi:hypothetical protein